MMLHRFLSSKMHLSSVTQEIQPQRNGNNFLYPNISLEEIWGIFLFQSRHPYKRARGIPTAILSSFPPGFLQNLDSLLTSCCVPGSLYSFLSIHENSASKDTRIVKFFKIALLLIVLAYCGFQMQFVLQGQPLISIMNMKL